jgi:hypothetical protein
MSFNNTTSTTTATSSSSSNYLIPVIVVSAVLVVVGLIAIITYMMKIKLKSKSKSEFSRMNSIFKKNYVEHNKPPEVSSFSLKVSNAGSDLSMGNSVVGNASNLTSNKNINMINYKSLNYQMMTKGDKYKAAETDSQNANHSSTNRNIELTTSPNKFAQPMKRVSLVTTNLIEIIKKKKAQEN